MSEVEVWEIHMAECPECCESMLIRDPVQNGDILVCPHCKKKSKISGICGAYRADKSKATHDGEAISL